MRDIVLSFVIGGVAASLLTGGTWLTFYLVQYIGPLAAIFFGLAAFVSIIVGIVKVCEWVA